MTGAGAAAMASPCTLERTIDCAGTRIPAVQAAAAGRKQVMSMPRCRGRHQPRDGRCAGASRFGFQKINGGGIHDAMPAEVGPTSTCLIYPRGAARGAAPAAACCPPELTLSQDAPMHKLSLGSTCTLRHGYSRAAPRRRRACARRIPGWRAETGETIRRRHAPPATAPASEGDQTTLPLLHLSISVVCGLCDPSAHVARPHAAHRPETHARRSAIATGILRKAPQWSPTHRAGPITP